LLRFDAPDSPLRSVTISESAAARDLRHSVHLIERFGGGAVLDRRYEHALADRAALPPAEVDASSVATAGDAASGTIPA
jgi:hypothetical protein